MSPRRVSPAPPSPSDIIPETQPSSHIPPKHSRGQQPPTPNTDAPLPKVPHTPQVKSPPLRHLPKLKMPSRPNINAARSTPPVLFPKNSPLPKSPQSLPTNPFQFGKSNSSRQPLKDGALLQRGRVPPSFLQPSQRNAVPSTADLSSTPKSFTLRRRSSVEVVKTPSFPIPRPRSATGPFPSESKKMGKKPSFSKLKLSSKGPSESIGLQVDYPSLLLLQVWRRF